MLNKLLTTVIFDPCNFKMARMEIRERIQRPKETYGFIIAFGCAVEAIYFLNIMTGVTISISIRFLRAGTAHEELSERSEIRSVHIERQC